MATPLTVHVTIKIEPSKLPELYAALRPVHEKLVQEEKCLYVNTFEILGPPGVVQAKKEYYLPFFETVGKIALEPQTVEILIGVEGFKFVKS